MLVLALSRTALVAASPVFLGRRTQARDARDQQARPTRATRPGAGLSFGVCVGMDESMPATVRDLWARFMPSALMAIRLSHETDESSSPERRNDQTRGYRGLRDRDMAHLAADLDVSGARSSGGTGVITNESVTSRLPLATAVGEIPPRNRPSVSAFARRDSLRRSLSNGCMSRLDLACTPVELTVRPRAVPTTGREAWRAG